MSANMSSTTARKAQDQPDVAESMARRIDEPIKRTSGLSLFHWLTIGSIGASIALFLAGKKNAAIFIGLWPPTFQALKAASENKQAREF
ncbi:MAG TPA: hypothetical protein VFQ92_24020 [Blastocatellia bacterium]|nr:hypothetical protein [Blastocatellia bacterium]